MSDRLGRIFDRQERKCNIFCQGYWSCSCRCYHCESLQAILHHVPELQIPQGPYLAKVDGGIQLTEVYRVYRDEAQAFTSPVVHTIENTFTDLSTPVAGLNTLSIPVPSRLYTMDLPNPRPLEGRRIAVKDLFDMAGLQTGGGSRAYFNTYPAKEVTAVAIQHLVGQVCSVSWR